jgi:hypothetical protein
VATEHVARGVSATRRDGIYDGDGDEEACLTYHKVAFQITEADLPAPRKVRLGGVSSVFAERHRRDATAPPFHNHGQISRQTYRVCRKISCGWCRIEFGTACYSVVKRSSPTTMKAVYISPSIIGARSASWLRRKLLRLCHNRHDEGSTY